MNVTYVYADSLEEWNCSEWRCAVPARAFRRTARHNATMISIPEFAQNTAQAQEACNEADLIVVQRNLFNRVLTMIQHWQALGKTVIADFDDAYNLIHPTVKNYKFWMEGKYEVNRDGKVIGEDIITPTPLKQFRWGLQLVHGASVPCRMLAEDWQQLTDMIIVPNYLELSKYGNLPPKNSGDKIIIGWGGSLSHLQSFEDSGVLEALKAVCKARPKVRLMICGDRRVFDRIMLPAHKKIYQPFVPALEWSYQIAKFDIGIAPLHGEYDKRRSWIKVLEYMIMKVPWIATNYPPYEDLIPYGKVVQNNPEQWEQALLEVIDHLEDYKHFARTSAYTFALNQNIDDNIESIISSYSKIIERSTTEQ